MPIEHPYEHLAGGTWLRGNLHAHTDRTDGVNSLQTVVDRYAGLGYGFLAVTDHDLFTDETDYAALDRKGLVLLPGNEVTADGPHMLQIGGTRRVAPGERQGVLDEVGTTGGFAIVNHPNWLDNFDHCPIELLREWRGYTGIEIYNGVVCRLQGSPYGTNKWDMLLTDGRRVLGFANDDSHEDRDYKRGWTVAYVRERTPSAVAEALTSGRFYASTGVEIDRIAVEGHRITISTPNAQRIVALHDSGARFAEADGPLIEVEAPTGSRYVRFECWGCGESFAWTQPFWV